MSLTADEDIARILAATDSIALVGASHKAERPSYRVMQYLLHQGYRVYPVNPGLAGQRLLGCEVYPDLAAIPAAIDMVDVFRQSRFLQEVVDAAIVKGVATVWTQLGVVDLAAAAVAEKAGLEVVMDRCPAIELPRLQAMGLMPLERNVI